jgi:hypothetical protein
MCDQCDYLNIQIERFQRFSDPATDQLTKERVAQWIQQLKAQRAGLHPQQDQYEAAVAR